MRERIVTTLAALTLVLGWALPCHANVLELTSRPTTNDMVVLKPILPAAVSKRNAASHRQFH